MRYRERVWTPAPPVDLPVTLADFKVHARIYFDDEDALIEGTYLPAAISYVERETQRLLTERSCTLRLPALPGDYCSVELPGGAVSSVESVVCDGVTVDADAYEVVGDSPARLLALEAWPVAAGRGLPVTITYTAGFQDAPAELRQAVMLIAAEAFRRRTEADAEPLQRIPLGAAEYIRKWRIMAL